mmetsp:Transcript_21934/g.48491  ORF Transcript_21934/g.48491 Transcript_21934/m.48491 type:complete len:225 (-) Transcript_21934:754-1428(-)
MVRYAHQSRAGASHHVDKDDDTSGLRGELKGCDGPHVEVPHEVRHGSRPSGLDQHDGQQPHGQDHDPDSQSQLLPPDMLQTGVHAVGLIQFMHARHAQGVVCTVRVQRASRWTFLLLLLLVVLVLTVLILLVVGLILLVWLSRLRLCSRASLLSRLPLRVCRVAAHLEACRLGVRLRRLRLGSIAGLRRLGRSSPVGVCCHWIVGGLLSSVLAPSRPLVASDEL